MKLTSEARSRLSGKSFALPGGRYPIPDRSHGVNALARVSQHGSLEEKSRVRSAVHRKFPGIEQAHADGGRCMSCGGMVNANGKAEGGYVDEDSPESTHSPQEAHTFDDEEVMPETFARSLRRSKMIRPIFNRD